MRDPRHRRHDGTEERDEAAEEHRPAAAFDEQRLRAVDLVLPFTHHLQLEDRRAVVRPDPVADRVTHDGGGDDDGEHDRQARGLLTCGDPREHRGGLPGDHEADEQRVLCEDHQADDDVDPAGGNGQDLVHRAVGLTRTG